MKEIIIESDVYGNVICKVDDIDYTWLKKFNWNISESKGNLYVTARSVDKNDKKRKFRIHQLIKMPYNETLFVIDHINGDTLDNQRHNLRLATHTQNNRNRKPQANKKIPYKGVWTGSYKDKIYFRVQLMHDGKKVSEGGFKTAEDAARRYNELARQYHGEFAYQNPV